MKIVNIFIIGYFWEEDMGRDRNRQNIVLYSLISLMMILSAINPVAAYASAPADKTTPPLIQDTTTPTPTFAETPIPSETLVEVTPALTLTLQSDPTYITPGGQVTFLYHISNVEKITETTLLRFHAPLGLTPVNPEEGKWDETAFTFEITSTEFEGKIAWQADETIVPPVEIYAELIQGGKTIAEAKLELSELVEYKVETSGGTAEGKDGQVQVTFPQGAVSETVTVKVTEPSYESLPVQSLSGSPFEIIAVSDSSKAEVSTFAKPVEIQVRYDEAELEGDEKSLMLFWYDPSDGEWKPPLSQRVDTENNILIATTNHFTTFDTYTSNWQSAETPTMSAFQTSDFIGSATFSLPFKLPAGPGGFQPSLVLNYSSSIVDNATSETQASWVGMGWSLDAGGYIERLSKEDPLTHKNLYHLTINGTSIELYSGADGKYHASNENFYRVEYNTTWLGGEEQSTWTIWDTAGNQYFFEERAYRPAPNWCPGGVGFYDIDRKLWRWMLSSVQNIHGQEMEYSYFQESKQVSYADCSENWDGTTITNWVYPQTITYPNERYRVVFERTTARADQKSVWLNQFAFPPAFQKSLLNAVRIEQDASGTGAWSLIRKYQFNYCQSASCNIFPDLIWEEGGRTPTLVSVQEFGLGGTNSLPANTFAYDDDMHLTSASNGYGGTIAILYNDYDHDGMVEPASGEAPWSASIPYAGWNPNQLNFFPPAWGFPKEYHFTQSQENWSGGGGFPPTGGVTYNGGSISIWGQVKNSKLTSYQPGRWYQVLAAVKADNGSGTHNIQLGFGYKDTSGTHDLYGPVTSLTTQYQVVSSGPIFLPANATGIIPKMNSTGASRVKWYYIYPLTSAYRVTSRSVSAGGDTLTYKYDYVNPAVNSPDISDAAAGDHPYVRAYTEFRGHEIVTITDPFGGRVQNKYHQDDALAGMLEWSTLSNGSGVLAQKTSSLYDVTEAESDLVLKDYDTNDFSLYGQPFDALIYRWVRTASETREVYQADGSTLDGWLTTSYDYDDTLGSAYYSYLLSQSVSGSIPNTLTTSYQYLPPIITTEQYILYLPTQVAVSNGTDTLGESLNYYDSNGIPTKTRTLMDSGMYSQMDVGYDAWGNVTSQTVYTEYSNGSNDPATGGQTTTTTYDSVYHTYPLTITNALTQTTTLTYDYTLGVPLSAYGPNGTDTKVEAEYDDFGRLVKLIRPGDDSTSPTLQIAYGTSPFSTTVTQKIQNGQFYSVTRQYDGLGRPTSVSAGGTSTLYQYGYDSGVRADYVSTPYASGETYYWAETKYDSLGRAWKAIAPDGTQTTYTYSGLQTSVTDANSVTTMTTTDILGRTTFVDAPIGPDITFGYDDLGNLTSASRGGATTTMNYDLGGRKTSMSDPDMGAWTYDYDALSNLKFQTDARGCTLTMNYDSLNRLDTRTSSGNCGQQVSVDYGYDSGAYGIGFRTSMSDGSGSSPTTWEYDERGLLVKEIKRIDNQSFTTEWTYNSADMPVSMIYPDGEMVTSTYNNQMLLTSVAGSETYASSFVYDSASRLKALTIGSTLGQRYYYKDWNVQGGGRLDMTVTGTGTYTDASKTFANTLLKNSYSYDSVGNITGINDSVWGETQTFGYDSLYRLTSASATGGLANYSESYTYDPATGNLKTKNGLVLDYPAANGARPHAVTSAGSNTYGYDANGNQTTRTIAGQTVTLAYDAENRMVSATGTNLSAAFTYDGDGRRVKSVVNGETILFAGGHYELKGNEVTKYYFAGASRIAVRKYIVPQSSTLTYLAGDHLGSTSLAVDASTGEVTQTRYKPWGEVRYTTPSKTLPTRYTFTGQYSYVDDVATDLGAAGFGLMFYNTRWYDPALGRFTQADTIVPGGVQGLDRYAYVGNSPVVYTDPSGHAQERSDYQNQVHEKQINRVPLGQGFTPGAIYDYLLSFCNGEPVCADGIYAAWEADAEWWQMIRSAQPGDVLFGQYSGRVGNVTGLGAFTATFTGDGVTSLTGITKVTGASNNTTLVDIQIGRNNGRTASGQRNPQFLYWIGFYRLDGGNQPQWYVRSGYDIEDLGARALDLKMQNGIIIGSAAVGIVGCLPFAKGGAVICGFVTGYVSAWTVDGLDLESTDHAYQVGPLYFNFQLNANDYTVTLEHVYMSP
ncbi:MAG: hypothetical protein HFACDABA_02463 [Anaerolineales bacterium]|nr:hypothetical protein [Anaerolineales bacterium]